MKALAPFSELGPGFGETSGPAVYYLDASMSERKRRLCALYLVRGSVVRHVMERIPDVIDGEPIYLSGSIQSDGEWVWRMDLAHYVLKYGVRFPIEFMECAESNLWTPPYFTDEELAHLVHELHRIDDGA